MELISLFVPGRPRTKGSMKCLGGRSHNMVEQVTESKPWRDKIQRAIVREVRQRLAAEGPLLDVPLPYTGAVIVSAAFSYERPATGVGVDLPYPTIEAGVNANGDVDKLFRNLLDALQGSGLIKNDAQVVQGLPSKRWAGATGAGVFFRVSTL